MAEGELAADLREGGVELAWALWVLAYEPAARSIWCRAWLNAAWVWSGTVREQGLAFQGLEIRRESSTCSHSKMSFRDVFWWKTWVEIVTSGCRPDGWQPAGRTGAGLRAGRAAALPHGVMERASLERGRLDRPGAAQGGSNLEGRNVSLRSFQGSEARPANRTLTPDRCVSSSTPLMPKPSAC